jgi:sugar phosphate isomerase/epimerase
MRVEEARVTVPTIGWTLWAATVGFDGPLEERLEAAAGAGYQRLSLSPVDVARSAEAGVGAGSLRHAAESRGLRWILDPVVAWLPAGAASRSPLARFSIPDVAGIAETLDAVSMSAIALTSKAHETDRLAEAFAGLCDAVDGVDVHLEFLPMTVVTDVRTAWDVVRAAGRDNGGIVFDTWHFFRGNPDLDVLAGIPGDRIFAVQVNDASSEPSGTLWEDTFHRLLPGDGDFDLASVMGVLDSIGGLSWVGPEVFSEELSGLGATEAARLGRNRIERI